MVALQEVLYFITLVLASLAALLGISFAGYLFRNKKLFNNLYLFIFTFLAVGYSCFALAEICWYLIFDVFNQTPSVSMPDFYWVLGSFCLLIAFLIFFIYLSCRQGNLRKSLSLFFFSGLASSILVYLFLNAFLSTAGKTSGQIFVGYFYPLASALILISSFGVYLFSERIEKFSFAFLLFFLANLAFLLGDLFYTYYSFKEIYGAAGILSDLLYIAAYSICALSFALLLKEIKAETRAPVS